MKREKLLLLLIVLIPTFAFTQSEVELIIEKGTYRPRSNYYQFILKSYVQNNSKDTIRIFHPHTSGFKSEFQKPAVSFIGENDKPYEVIFDAEKICEGDKKKTVIRDIEPKYLNIVPSSILTIPPGQRSKTIHSSFYANQKICPEIEAKVKIIYAPDYEQLSKEDRMFLEEKDKEFFALLEETEAYFLKENLKTQRLNGRLTLAGTLLRSYAFLEKLYTDKIISNQINLEIKK